MRIPQRDGSNVLRVLERESGVGVHDATALGNDVRIQQGAEGAPITRVRPHVVARYADHGAPRRSREKEVQKLGDEHYAPREFRRLVYAAKPQANEHAWLWMGAVFWSSRRRVRTRCLVLSLLETAPYQTERPISAHSAATTTK